MIVDVTAVKKHLSRVVAMNTNSINACVVVVPIIRQKIKPNKAVGCRMQVILIKEHNPHFMDKKPEEVGHN